MIWAKGRFWDNYSYAILEHEWRETPQAKQYLAAYQ